MNVLPPPPLIVHLLLWSNNFKNLLCQYLTRQVTIVDESHEFLVYTPYYYCNLRHVILTGNKINGKKESVFFGYNLHNTEAVSITYVNDKKHGPFGITRVTETVIKGICTRNFVDGVVNCLAISKDHRRSVYSQYWKHNFKMGISHGTSVSYWATTRTSRKCNERLFENGILRLDVHFFANGKVRQKKIYDQYGNIVEEQSYNHNHDRICTNVYDDNGDVTTFNSPDLVLRILSSQTTQGNMTHKTKYYNICIIQ